MSKVPEEVKDGIRKNLLAGASIRETAESYGVSVSTVKRIKKEMPDAVWQSDNSPSSDYSNTYYTKSEAEYVKRLNDDAELFEDPDEGWVFHVSQSNLILKTCGKWWIGIAYPESAPKNWVERLKLVGCEIAISPLHDRDVWSHDSPACVDRVTGRQYAEGERYKAGDPKKAHWHFILKFDKSMSAQEVNRLVRPITFGPYLQKAYSLEGAYRYFLHKDNPEKCQLYLEEDIRKYNNFHVEPNTVERRKIMQNVLKEACEEKWTGIGDFLDRYRDDSNVIDVVVSKPAVLNRLLKENYAKTAPKEDRSLTSAAFTEGIDRLIKALKG